MNRGNCLSTWKHKREVEKRCRCSVRETMDDDLFLLSLFTAVLSDVRSERPPLVAGRLRLRPRRPTSCTPRAYPQRTDRKPFRPAGATDRRRGGHLMMASRGGSGGGMDSAVVDVESSRVESRACLPACLLHSASELSGLGARLRSGFLARPLQAARCCFCSCWRCSSSACSCSCGRPWWPWWWW